MIRPIPTVAAEKKRGSEESQDVLGDDTNASGMQTVTAHMAKMSEVAQMVQVLTDNDGKVPDSTVRQELMLKPFRVMKDR